MRTTACRALPGALLVLALLPAGCGGRPAPPPTQPQVILQTEAHDRKVGEEESKKLGGEMGLLDHPELTAYVNAIGRRLARHAPRRGFDYEFGIVDEDSPNAFALPGGFIYVSRGLLILTDSEDELANVIAHEIIHVAARHAAARQSVVRGVPAMFQWSALGYFASYSRDQEREADRLGQGLSGLAGFDPQGMATFLKDLEYTERLRLGASRLPGFLDIHPATTERVAASASRSRMITWSRTPGIARDRADYLRRLDGLAVGTRASEGVFQGDRFLHPDLGFTMRFPPGWETRNTRRAVGAISPRREGQVFLEHQGRGDDPRQAGDEFVEKASRYGLRVESCAPLKLGGSTAYRVEGRAGTPYGPLQVFLTFIAHNGSIYRLTGISTGGLSGKFQGSFRNVARSFRPLPPGLRTGIRETRLRIVTAHGGERLDQLSDRTGNQWDIQQTAVMNNLFANQVLESGQLVKIAVSESYRPTSAAR